MTQTELVNTIKQKIREIFQLLQKADQEHNENVKFHIGGQMLSLFEVGVIIQDNEIEPEWIPVTTRPLDEEEKTYFSRIYGEDGITGIFDCRLPDCESCVLITTKYGVTITNYDPEYGFEDYDAEEMLAWMPLPRPYKAESEG